MDGERTLSDIAAFLSSDKNSAQILVAGCQSVPASAESLLPAGEATVLWLAGCKGAVFLSRGEIFSPSATESLKDVCERAQEQSELSVAPDACILFLICNSLSLLAAAGTLPIIYRINFGEIWVSLKHLS